MLLRRLGLGSPILFAVLGVCLFGQATKSFAQPTDNRWYNSDNCMWCHPDRYGDWAQHGHAWMEIRVDGKTPDPHLFDSIIMPPGEEPITVPTLAADTTWADVEDIFGHFKENDAADLLLKNGKFKGASSTGTGGSLMPGRCNKCHNTGGNDLVNGQQYGNANIQGTWQLNSIQCEQCHRQPLENGTVDHMAIPDKQICRDCHSSSNDKGKNVPGNDPLNPDAAKFGFRISSSDGLVLTQGHGQGDEYRRSPHQNIGCAACHDPHKSVWHERGGVRFEEEQGGEGFMCKQCHIDVRIRGSMGEMGMECTDCHMPMTSGRGSRHSHFFQINSAAVRADNGKPNIEANNFVKQPNDTGTQTNYWMNYDGTTGAGRSFITLDMVCVRCHANMSMEQLSAYAKFIHREPNLIDVTANGVDKLLIAKPTTTIGVQYSVYPEGRGGMPAEMWVVSQGPKGWTYWNGKAWKRGMKAWKTSPLAEETVKLPKVKLAKGGYSYFVEAFPSDGSEEVDAVSIYVSKK